MWCDPTDKELSMQISNCVLLMSLIWGVGKFQILESDYFAGGKRIEQERYNGASAIILYPFRNIVNMAEC